MPFVLTIQNDGEDYVLIEHAGESIRVSVARDTANHPDRVKIMFREDNSEKVPDMAWRFIRRKIREFHD